MVRRTRRYSAVTACRHRGAGATYAEPFRENTAHLQGRALWDAGRIPFAERGAALFYTVRLFSASGSLRVVCSCLLRVFPTMGHVFPPHCPSWTTCLYLSLPAGHVAPLA